MLLKACMPVARDVRRDCGLERREKEEIEIIRFLETVLGMRRSDCGLGRKEELSVKLV
jgi:hypothetical protein